MKTVKSPITSCGRLWMPGEPVTSMQALDRIDPEHLVDLAGGGLGNDPTGDKAVEHGFQWYDGRTVSSVLAGVGDDPGRAAYALEREQDRDQNRQRSGVIGPLTEMLAVPDAELVAALDEAPSE